jgi:hypothetical protein
VRYAIVSDRSLNVTGAVQTRTLENCLDEQCTMMTQHDVKETHCS